MPTPLPPFLRFAPLLKERVWGGDRLRGLATPGDQRWSTPTGTTPTGTTPTGPTPTGPTPTGPTPTGPTPIGEAWLLADLPESITDGVSPLVARVDGARTIRDLMRVAGRALLGSATAAPAGRFPLLVKLLDARQNLSVQVHPTPAYVARHPEADVKDEAWVILDAAPGAVLHVGLRPDVDLARFRSLLAADRLDEALVTIPARVGDCHVLPSGTCHALGAGILVAEVQTPSDTTFRVHDWGRTGRELHVTEAVESIFGAAPPPHAAPSVAVASSRSLDDVIPIRASGVLTRVIAETPQFRIERIDATTTIRLPVDGVDRPVLWIAITDGIELRSNGAAHELDGRLAPGTLALTPARTEAGHVELEPAAAILRVEPCTELDRALA